MYRLVKAKNYPGMTKGTFIRSTIFIACTLKFCHLTVVTDYKNTVLRYVSIVGTCF